jgi:hypothetical protein
MGAVSVGAGRRGRERFSHSTRDELSPAYFLSDVSLTVFIQASEGLKPYNRTGHDTKQSSSIITLNFVAKLPAHLTEILRSFPRPDQETNVRGYK